MAQGEETRRGFARLLPAALLLILAIAAYGAVSFYALFNGHTSTEEVAALVKSWWYVTGAVTPYTATDATWRMPLYFTQLGLWQQLEGIGHVPGRLMSIGFGGLSAVVLFFLCRRLTANTLVSAAAVFIFLASPATTIFFVSATPAATVTLLHLLAAWIIVANMGKPRAWVSVIMGLVCVALYFYRQSMIVSIVVLAPLYILAIGRQRTLHAVIVLAAMAAGTAAVFAVFPPKLMDYAMRLPAIMPLLESAGVLAPNFTLIDKGTTGLPLMRLALGHAEPMDFVVAFVLPYAGTLILALLLLFAARGPLRILWIVPLYFLWQAAAHYLGTASTCGHCIAADAAYFAAFGALAGALTLAMLSRWAKMKGIPVGVLVLVGAIGAVGLNVFASGLIKDPAFRFFPRATVQDARPETEQSDMQSLARWLGANLATKDPALVIHGLGGRNLPSLPYAVFLAGHVMPPQSFDLYGTKRTINGNLKGTARESVQAAIEEESLWSDETMQRWITRDYDIVVLHDDASVAHNDLIRRIAAEFDLAATTSYRGQDVRLFTRRPAQ